MSLYVPSEIASYQPDEEQVVDAAIALLERLESGNAGPTRRPDRENRNTQDVDGVVTIGDRPFALEHTRVEQFSGALELTAKLHATESEWLSFKSGFIDTVQTGSFEIYVIGLDVQPKRMSVFLTAAAVRLAEMARSLATPGDGTYSNVSTFEVREGRSYAVFRVVRGYGSEADGAAANVRFLHHFSEKGEGGDRVAVLDPLLAKKMKKLDTYAATHGTVLVLESRAFIASPHSLLLIAAQRLRTGQTSTPQYLIVVSGEKDIWDLQYVRRSDTVSRELFRTNWWVMDPVTGTLVQKDWEQTSRRTLREALERRSDPQG